MVKDLYVSEESVLGSDGITLTNLRSVRPSKLAASYNLWLLAGYTPERFVAGETILIPTGGDQKNSANYWPITSVTRPFHKILAARLACSVPLDPRQKAFWPVTDVLIMCSSWTPHQRRPAEKEASFQCSLHWCGKGLNRWWSMFSACMRTALLSL